MIRLFLFSCMLLSFVSYAQNETQYFVSLENSSNNKIESDFFIEKVYDGRQIKSNIGSAQKSIFNKKVLAVVEKPLSLELQKYFDICFPKEAGKKALSIRVNEFYVSEHTDSKTETGCATVVFDFIERAEGIDYIIGSYSSFIKSDGIDVTSGHEQRLIQAINECIVAYLNSNVRSDSKIVFNSNQKLDDSSIPIYKAGVYLNYIDVFNGTCLDMENFTVTKYQDKYCLLNNKSGKVENAFYGFNDGKSFYINLFRYSNVKVYAKTEVMGVYYFIDEVQSNSIDYTELRDAFFGLSALYLFPDTTESKLPLLIDRFTGSPIFLTNSFMVNLLSPNSNLLKEYRRTSRSSEDKKRLYKKYFGLN
ncbi:hypothetical protein MCETHM1_02580 [Flavobacteriaceae bacterium]